MGPNTKNQNLDSILEEAYLQEEESSITYFNESKTEKNIRDTEYLNKIND